MCASIVEGRSLVETLSFTPAYINRVPNEILRHIFSFLKSNSTVVQTKHGTLRYPTILVLRMVSQLFRTTATECQFWNDDDFDFCEPFRFIEDHSNIIKSRYITNLFSDKQLATCLSDKSGWKFRHLETFLVTVMAVPDLPRNARRIYFEYLPDGIAIAIRRLSMFASVTTLHISLCYLCEDIESSSDDYDGMPDKRVAKSESTFDLDLLAETCPCLQELVLKDFWQHSGTLASLGKLKTMDIEFDYGADITLASSILPLNSVQTFTTLKLRHYNHVAADFNLSMLDSFVHLKDLDLTILLPDVCHFLCRTKLELTTFTTDMGAEYEPEVPDIIAALKAPSLKFLQRLSFGITPNYFSGFLRDADTHCTMIEPIFTAITNIPTLQNLELEMGIKPSWCQRFTMLTNLKSLTLLLWFVDFDDYPTALNLYLKYWDRHEYIMSKDRKVEIRAALDSVFAEFPHKPLITIR